MFAVLHSDINSHKSGFLHLTGQPYWKKSRSAKVKDGIINLFLRNNFIDQYTWSITSEDCRGVIYDCNIFKIQATR